MIYIFLGILSFLLFLTYDINRIILKNKLLNSCFFAGFILLTAATTGILITAWYTGYTARLRTAVWIILAAAFLILLIYTLFFALPFKNTYLDEKGRSLVCQKGVYALCRHPGVIWFTGFYICLGQAFPTRILINAAVCFCLCNVLYVFIQDKWIFTRTIVNYDMYKRNTPFLLPNRRSMKRCFRAFVKLDGGMRNEF